MTYTQVISPAHPERQEIYEVIRNHPGITFAEICAELPHIERRKALSAVATMNEAVIRPCCSVRIGNGKMVNGYRVI